MSHAQGDTLWPTLNAYLDSQSLIPVLGPGCITFGDDDTPLYPWLARRVAEELGITLDPAQEPTLHAVTCAHLRQHREIEEVSLALNRLLADPGLQPGPTLRDLTRIGAFKLFLTLGFDPLLERALRQVPFRQGAALEVWDPSMTRNLPVDPRDATGRMLVYLFGKVGPNPRFHLWDHDAIEFVWSLQAALPTHNPLAATLATNNLLILGTDFSDWLVRFFLRAIRQKPLNDSSHLPLLLADRCMHGKSESALFYDCLRGQIRIIDQDPLSFASTFARRAVLSHGLLDQAQTQPLAPAVESSMPPGTFFISYAREDADAARTLCEGLREAGCHSWLDLERLKGGEDFVIRLRKAVMQECTYFISLISRTTEGRREAYFHKERFWAADRHESVPLNEEFYIGVRIDQNLPVDEYGKPLPIQNEHPHFWRKTVVHLPGGRITPGFAERARALDSLARRISRP